jgi:hypothetical protein
MSNPTTPFGWQMPTATDLVTDLPADFEVFGQAVATSMADLLGGTTGQVLSKTTNADMDFTWVTTDDANAIQNSIVDAKGDLIGATAADTPARLAVGTNGQVLTADSTAATGLKWATPASGGKVLQVVTATKTDTFTTSSTSFVDLTGLSCTITPASATSKILVFASINFGIDQSQGQSWFRLDRAGTAIAIGDTAGSRTRITGGGASAQNYFMTSYAITFLDSPSTTSSTTYKVQTLATAQTTYINRTVTDTDAASYPRGISTLTVMEIGA